MALPPSPQNAPRPHIPATSDSKENDKDEDKPDAEPNSDEPSGSPSSLSPEEKQQKEDEEVEDKKPASAYVIYRAISEVADEELSRSVKALSFSALAAGLSMGFSLVAEGLLQHHLPDAPWRPLLSKLGYPVGFLIVILGRQQLFTENTLSPVLTLLRDKHVKTLLKVLRLWSIVFFFNMVGTFLFAQAVAHSSVFEPEMKKIFHELGQKLLEVPVSTAFLRSIFAGWLIALMVWLLPGAETGRIPMITILTYIIGLAHFNHIIAGSTEAFYLLADGSAGWPILLTRFLLPTLAGNILGGVTLVAALNFGQAALDENEKEQQSGNGKGSGNN